MERFVFEYHPDGELATRDIVSKAISDEMKKEHSKHIWLDVRHLPIETFKTKFPKVYNYCFENGIDVSKDLIPITPAAHYQCGGIVVDEMGSTSINQLFAIGECSHTGLHGANRLASNSLLEAIVYAHDLSKNLEATIDEVKNSEAIITPIRYKNIHHDEILQFRNQLQHFMKYDSLYDNTKNTEKVFEMVTEMSKRFKKKFKNYNSHPFLCETYNLIQTAEIILKDSLPKRYRAKSVKKEKTIS
jgi:L-aspartate oxidase